MLNYIIVGVAIVFSAYLAFSKQLARSSRWRATATPLANAVGGVLRSNIR